jgi:hypothetical protein
LAAVRKAHVKRIRQIARNSDDTADIVNDDIWIDVLRIDKLPVVFQGSNDGSAGQVINYVLKWNDDPNNPASNIDSSNADLQFENANASRKTKLLEIRDPTAPKDDSTASVHLWTVEKIKIKIQGKATGAESQLVNLSFNNHPFDGSDGRPSNRTTSVLKIFSNDLNDLRMTNDDGTAIIYDWDTYRDALLNGNVNPDDQFFLTVEYTDKFTVQFGANADTGAVGQNIVFNLTGNRNIENLFYQGDLHAKNADGNSAVIRLDPFQTIVNVGQNIIAVKFAAGEK